MTDLPKVAVTGATGHVGGAVARALAERGVEQRLVVRAPERAPELAGSVVRGCSYGDREAAEAALSGVHTLLMVSASESVDRREQHLTFVDAAATAGVRQIVYTSFVNVAPDAIFTLARDHNATEQRIVASGMAYTFLRDNFYLDFMELVAGEQRVIAGPAGDGRVGMVARADVARAATEVLLDPEPHAGVTYTLTGPEALTLTEAAERLTAARGRPVVGPGRVRIHASTCQSGAPSSDSFWNRKGQYLHRDRGRAAGRGHRPRRAADREAADVARRASREYGGPLTSTSMGQVAENLAQVRERIDAACRRAGRDPGEVRLMAVSKTQSAEVVREAYDAGLRLFGENRVQEAVEKSEALSAYPDLEWAMIGHLQTNKAREVAGFAREFHALDSMKIAEALNRRLLDTGRELDVYIQVNSSNEPQKFGLPPEQAEPFARDLARFGALRVRGLMTLAVFSADSDAVAACFDRMRTLQGELRAARVPGSYDELSMGMSGDFELAIAYGATTVRVGEAIFGPRR